MSPLDRAVWFSLATARRHLSSGDGCARRCLPDVDVFAAAETDGRAGPRRLTALVRSGERVFLPQAPPIDPPPTLRLVQVALGLQMIDAAEIRNRGDRLILHAW